MLNPIRLGQTEKVSLGCACEDKHFLRELTVGKAPTQRLAVAQSLSSGPRGNEREERANLPSMNYSSSLLLATVMWAVSLCEDGLKL